MKYQLLCLFVCLAIAGLSAQSGLSWGVEVYPNISNRRLIAQPTIPQTEINAVNASETSKFSYTVGGVVSWRQERIGFKTGLLLMESGYQTVRQEVDLRDDIPAGAEEEQTAFQHYFLEVPAELYFYQSLNDRNDFLFSMGLTAAFNVANRERVTYFFGDTDSRESVSLDNSEFTNLHFSFITSMGYQYAVSEGFRLVIQPTFQFWLRSLLNNPNAEYNRNLYSLGVRLGGRF